MASMGCASSVISDSIVMRSNPLRAPHGDEAPGIELLHITALEQYLCQFLVLFLSQGPQAASAELVAWLWRRFAGATCQFARSSGAKMNAPTRCGRSAPRSWSATSPAPRM